MPNGDKPAPRQHQGVMISSTFTNLEVHKAALISAINGQELHVAAMDKRAIQVVKRK